MKTAFQEGKKMMNENLQHDLDRNEIYALVSFGRKQTKKGKYLNLFFPVYVGMVDAAMAIDPGISIEWHGPYTWYPVSEIDAIRTLTGRQVDGIIVTVAGPETLDPAINAAIQAGIPVISFDSDAPGSDRLTFVGTNHFTAGYLAGKTMAGWLGGQGHVVVATIPQAEHLDVRVQGFTTAMRELAPHITLHVTHEMSLARPGETLEQISVRYREALIRMFQTHPDVRGVFVTFARAGSAVAEAVEVLQVSETVQSLVFDVDEHVVKLVATERLRAVVGQDMYLMGYVSLILAHAARHAAVLPTKQDGRWRMSALQDFLDAHPDIPTDTGHKLRTIIMALEDHTPDPAYGIDTGVEVFGKDRILDVFTSEYATMRESLAEKIEVLGQEIIMRRQAERALRTVNQELEQRVQERTRDLEQAYLAVEQQVEARTAELQREIAERQRAEAEIRHLQRYLKNIINSMPAVLIGVDVEGKVTHWNREAETVTGVAADEAQGHLFTEVFPHLAAKMARVWQAIQEGRPQRETKVAHQHNGETRYADVTVYPLMANGAEGAVILVDDVTDRVRIEEMMIHTEKMMTVGGLAAGMAHEINNPLGVILQGIQNTQRRLSPDLPRNQEVAAALGLRLDRIRSYLDQRNILQYLHGMQEAGLRAAQIITNMLNFSRQSPSAMVPTDLNQLLEETIELAAKDYDLKGKYDFRHIMIIRTYETTLPYVYCIPTEIQQVVLNLLRNAAQALAEQSWEDDCPPSIHLTTRQEPDYVRIEIADNGPGMDEATRKRVFEPFYTTKAVGVGTGLGLSVSYFIIVTHHHGEISVESTPGRGTTFTLLLPLSKKQLEATREQD
jgi:PAS domain S-box-containing protein